MLTIYHTPGTRSFRVIWLCEELALPYEVVSVDFSAEYRSSPQWRRMNPVGKVPVMTDDALTMFESGAMVQYLLARYGEGRLEPERGTHAHALSLQWCWFAEATFSRPLGEIVNHKRAFPDAPNETVMEEMRDRARLCVRALDEALTDRDYLLGAELEVADIMMGYTVMLAVNALPEGLPSTAAAYWARLCERPAFKATKAAEASMA
jgi:glutathione S-transferase